MMKQKVSVITPVYNSQAYLENTVRSVLNQTYSNFEYILIDDCSKDMSNKILEKLSQEDKRIKTIRLEKNMGAGYAREMGLKVATGDYIAFIDSDDVWVPHKLEKQIELLKQNNKAIIITKYYEGKKTISPPERITKRMMFFSNWIPTSTSLFPSTLKSAKNMSHIRSRQDYVYWLKLFASNEGLVALTIQEPLVTYAKRPGSLSSSPIKNLKNNFLVFNKELKFNFLMSTIFVLFNVFFRIIKSVSIRL